MTITEDINANGGNNNAEEVDSETGRSAVPEILSNEEEQAVPILFEEPTIKCWFLPHGSYSMIPAVLATIGWLA